MVTMTREASSSVRDFRNSFGKAVRPFESIEVLAFPMNDICAMVKTRPFLPIIHHNLTLLPTELGFYLRIDEKNQFILSILSLSLVFPGLPHPNFQTFSPPPCFFHFTVAKNDLHLGF
jgi:hypothetical protein